MKNKNMFVTTLTDCYGDDYAIITDRECHELIFDAVCAWEDYNKGEDVSDRIPDDFDSEEFYDLLDHLWINEFVSEYIESYGYVVYFNDRVSKHICSYVNRGRKTSI